MPRIRTLKPEFWADEKLAPLSPIDRLVFVGLISHADDAGRLVDNIKLLDGLLFPETDDTSRSSLETLARLSRIFRYRSESGQRLLQICNWEKHQRVDKPSKYNLPGPLAQLPAPQELDESSGESREDLATSSGESRAPTYDHLPSTDDLRPTINTTPEPAANGNAAAWMHAVWEEVLGLPSRPLSLTTDRRQKYLAMYDEQLRGTPDPEAAWRAVLHTVSKSDHHTSKRAFLMPESLLLNANRRERWVQEAIELLTKGPTTAADRKIHNDVADLTAYLENRHAD